MTRRLLLVSLAAGALTTPLPASSAATELAINGITVRPAEPVVRPSGSVRLVIDVIAKGVAGKDGVTIKVEPGAPPAQAPSATPSPSPSPSPGAGLRLAHAGDGWETWRFLPQKGLNRFYPAGPWTITATAKGADGEVVTQYASFQLRRETRLTSVRVGKARETHGVRLSGWLNKVDPSGYSDYVPFGGQKVEILYRKEATDIWEVAGTAVTKSTGAFGRTIQDRPNGYWRIRFPGTGHYAPKYSSIRKIGE
ncbi:hypothetical protein [Nonomuraea sediminis]|uniref:hypothetical protein n=1 Tax=Nonomuraea sediminis TaxID=2835864 RepID=UPI001BDD1FDE|nr:hypothetical protein [Nonomuraea sediminis]